MSFMRPTKRPGLLIPGSPFQPLKWGASGNDSEFDLGTFETNQASALTMFAWARLGSPESGANKYNRLIHQTFSPGVLGFAAYRTTTGDTGRFFLYRGYSNTASRFTTTSEVFPIGEWTFVIAQDPGGGNTPSAWSGSLTNPITEYGGSYSQGPTAGIGTVLSTNTNNMNIGNAGGTATQGWADEMAVVGMIGRVLTAEEKVELQYDTMNFALSLGPDLMGLWAPGQQGLNAVFDYSNNGNHGISTGTALTYGAGLGISAVRARDTFIPFASPGAAPAATYSYPMMHRMGL